MMEVHPPYQSVHTWKDFSTHLGTITAGLLIALALQAGVEGLHHRHQRHQLEEALHEESVKNRAIIERNIQVVDHYILWLDGLQRRLVSARGSEERRGFSYPEGSASELGRLTQYSGLRSSVWQTAQTTGLIGLLPRETAQYYTRLYIQVERTRSLTQQLFDTTEAREGYEAAFSSTERSNVPEIAMMTREELIAYTLLVEKNLASARDLRLRYLFASGATNSILRGANSDEEVIAAEMAAIKSHPDPTAPTRDRPPVPVK